MTEEINKKLDLILEYTQPWKTKMELSMFKFCPICKGDLKYIAIAISKFMCESCGSILRLYQEKEEKDQ